MAEEPTRSALDRGGCSDSVPSWWTEQLFNDHWSDLVQCALRALGDSDRSAAEDLAADVIMALLSREFDRRMIPPENALAFAKAVIRNRALHCLRGRGRARVLADQLTEGDPADSWIRAASVRKQSAVHDAVRGLSPDHRRAVVMYYFRGWSIGDIASRERTTDGAIRVRLSRARGTLREQLRLFKYDL